MIEFVSFLYRRNVSLEVFLDSEFDRDIQNWSKKEVGGKFLKWGPEVVVPKVCDFK